MSLAALPAFMGDGRAATGDEQGGPRGCSMGHGGLWRCFRCPDRGLKGHCHRPTSVDLGLLNSVGLAHLHL